MWRSLVWIPLLVGCDRGRLRVADDNDTDDLNAASETDLDTEDSDAVDDFEDTDVPLGCGDGVLRVEAGEACDDGNRLAGDGCSPGCALEAYDFGTFPAADIVLGQTDFSGSWRNGVLNGPLTASGMDTPLSVVVVGARLYLADTGNGRVMIWSTPPTENSAPATGVIGRSSPTSTERDPDGGGMSRRRTQLCTDGVGLAAADSGLRRLVVYRQAPAEDAEADLVLGQPDMGTFVEGGPNPTQVRDPQGCGFGGGRLVLADTGNHRLLLWDSLPSAHGTRPDRVLGQEDLYQGSCNRGKERPNAASLCAPASAWTDGQRVVVADSGNRRVLVWDRWPATDGQPADHVLGQPDLVTARERPTSATSLTTPADLTVFGRQLYVADSLTHRVLVFDWPVVTNGPAAVAVIGQSSFTLSANDDADQDGVADDEPSARAFGHPSGVAVAQGRLWVSDAWNQRVLGFSAVSSLP